MAPTNLDVLRVNETMLAITLLAGGIEPQTAAWAIDALLLYVIWKAATTRSAASRNWSKEVKRGSTAENSIHFPP